MSNIIGGSKLIDLSSAFESFAVPGSLEHDAVLDENHVDHEQFEGDSDFDDLENASNDEWVFQASREVHRTIFDSVADECEGEEEEQLQKSLPDAVELAVYKDYGFDAEVVDRLCLMMIHEYWNANTSSAENLASPALLYRAAGMREQLIHCGYMAVLNGDIHSLRKLETYLPIDEYRNCAKRLLFGEIHGIIQIQAGQMPDNLSRDAIEHFLGNEQLTDDTSFETPEDVTELDAEREEVMLSDVSGLLLAMQEGFNTVDVASICIVRDRYRESHPNEAHDSHASEVDNAISLSAADGVANQFTSNSNPNSIPVILDEIANGMHRKALEQSFGIRVDDNNVEAESHNDLRISLVRSDNEVDWFTEWEEALSERFK